ncbi:hypothetical protein EC968_005391 [Mortierella alpina]|nr:hypothetical protein EC968_005391 [Mortierella alpina]
MAASSSKTKQASATAKIENVETTTTSTTTVTTVEETVATLEVVQGSSSSAALAQRELPIFSNVLIADATLSTSVPVKPKTGRVKAGTGKGAPSVSVLKINAPKSDGEVVVMRRMDTDLINATAMYNAAYAPVSADMEKKETQYLADKYGAQGAVLEKTGGSAFAGIWVTVPQAQDLAIEYGITKFMLPLLDAPKRKSTIKASSATTSVVDKAEKEEKEEAEEKEEKDEKVEKSTAAAVISSQETVVVEEKVEEKVEKTEEKVEEKTEEKIEEKVKITIAESTTQEEVSSKDEISDLEDKEHEKNEAVEEDEEAEASSPTSTVMKRRIEELEDQATQDKKRFRGLITVAVGIAAVAAIPQILPYFS